jgi:hypothetical protein
MRRMVSLSTGIGGFPLIVDKPRLSSTKERTASTTVPTVSEISLAESIS